MEKKISLTQIKRLLFSGGWENPVYGTLRQHRQTLPKRGPRPLRCSSPKLGEWSGSAPRNLVQGDPDTQQFGPEGPQLMKEFANFDRSANVIFRATWRG